MNTLISIVIPVYKVEKYLERCIESVLNQTYQNFEIILIDDGSPDRCGEICDEYQQKDNRIRVIHQENGGLSNARNTGINAVMGEYVTFIDSDDTIHPKMLEVLLKLMVDNEADIVASSLNIVKGLNNNFNFKKENKIIVGTGTDVLIEIMLNRSSWEACGKLFKYELFSDIQFYEGKVYEDFHFTPRIFSKAEKAIFVEYELYNYFQHENSIMGVSSVKMKKDLIEIIESNINYINFRYNFQSQEYQKLYAAFIKHSIGKLLGIVKKGNLGANKEYINCYKKFIIKNFIEIIKNKYINKNYKVGFFISMISVRLFSLFIN